jgi:hypothetical protein
MFFEFLAVFGMLEVKIGYDLCGVITIEELQELYLPLTLQMKIDL